MDYIRNVDILDEAKENFLTYASEVLTERAIPAAEDGLLSSQRKILWTMEDHLGMDNKSKTKKCNALVGTTLATSYYHGDSACYGVLCKMAQPYLMRYPLIDGQGSLGTQQSNDTVASSRYTEAKPSKYADLMMNDFGKNVVPLKPTYNNEYMEPVVLPALFPNAICNGRQTIGLSMAHNTLPHNLTEVCNAIIAYIKNNNLSIDELLEIMPGPDFPLVNTIINRKDIKTAFSTGHSSVSLKIRGEYEIKDNIITFTTIPYRVYRDKIYEQIQKNIDEFDKILDDFSDESNLGENRLIFKLKKGVNPQSALNVIFSLTDLQSTVSYNMNFIVNGTPKMCSMIDLIKAYVNHQENILINSAKYDKEKAEKRKHIIEGLLLILEDLDKAINLIRSSEDKVEAKNKLIETFHIDSVQADAVLNMKLSSLTKLDKISLKEELQEKIDIINRCKKIIEVKEFREEILIKKIEDLRNKYGDARRTKLINLEIPKEEKEKVIIEPIECAVVLTKDGNIKRITANALKPQRRNTKGLKVQEDNTISIIRTNTVDSLVIFSDKGKMYKITVNDIPEGTNSSKGTAITSLVKMDFNEKPSVIYSIYKDNPMKYVLFLTKNGIVKKTPIEEYLSMKKSGLAAIKLQENDEVASVTMCNDDEVIIATKRGQILHIDSKDIPISSRVAIGVKGIKLNEGDEAVAIIPIRDKTDTLGIFSEDGMGKRVKLSEFTKQGRNTKGVKGLPKDKTLAAIVLINDDDKILINGDKSAVYINCNEIPTALGRDSAGVLVIKNNKIMSVSKV